MPDTLRVTCKSRLYHADLLEAAKKSGGIKCLAAELGVCTETLSSWIRLKSCPTLTVRGKNGYCRLNPVLAKKWPHIIKTLYALTGKTETELFPEFLRMANLGAIETKKEETREVSAGLLLGLTRGVEKNDELDVDLKDAIHSVIKTLTPRQQQVLNMRYGIGCEPHTLAAVADKLKVTRERVRQLEYKGICKLRHPCRANVLTEAAKSAGISVPQL